MKLTGRALPLQGFRFSVRQRGETRWQVGSPEGEALLGGIELPETEFEFNWKKQSLGAGAEIDGSRIDTVEELVDILQSMVADSVLVTIEWDRWARVGWLREGGFPVGRPHEFRVDLEVEWVKLEERSQRKRPKPAVNYGTTLSTLADLWSSLLRAIRMPLTLSRGAQQRAEASVVTINDSIQRMDRVRRSYRDSVVGQNDVLGRFSEGMGRIVAEGAVLRAIAGENPHQVCPIDEPAGRVLFAHYRASLARAAALARWQAARERRRMLSEARPDVLFRHVAMQNEDLRLLAWRTYGRIEAWQDVARFNDLRGSVLTAGQSVLMPRLEAAGIA